MMAKAVKSTTKKRKSTKKRAVKKKIDEPVAELEKQPAAEPEEQTQPEGELATATATAEETAEVEAVGVEGENEALTAEEVGNLYNNARYVVPSLNRSGLQKLLHVTARSGIILDKLGNSLTVFNVDVVKERLKELQNE